MHETQQNIISPSRFQSEWDILYSLGSTIHIYFTMHCVINTYTNQERIRLNTLMPGRNKRHCTDDILKCIFLNENVWISLKIALKFVPKFQINNIPALVQIMAWRQPGDKPLSEPMIVILLTHTCVTRPQWVNAQCISNMWNVISSHVFCKRNTFFDASIYP